MSFCSNCGTEMKQSMLFCPTCGAKAEDVTQAQQPAAPQPQPQPNPVQPQPYAASQPVGYPMQFNVKKPPTASFALFSFLTLFVMTVVLTGVWIANVVNNGYGQSPLQLILFTGFFIFITCGFVGLFAYNSKCRKTPAFEGYSLSAAFAFIPSFAFVASEIFCKLISLVIGFFINSVYHYSENEYMSMVYTALFALPLIIVFGIVFVVANKKNVGKQEAQDAMYAPAPEILHADKAPIALYVFITLLFYSLFEIFGQIANDLDFRLFPYILYRIIVLSANIISLGGVIASGFIGRAIYNSSCQKTPGLRKYKLPVAFAALPAFGYVVKKAVAFLLYMIPETIYSSVYRYTDYGNYDMINNAVSSMCSHIKVVAMIIGFACVALVGYALALSFVRKVERVHREKFSKQNIQ